MKSVSLHTPRGVSVNRAVNTRASRAMLRLTQDGDAAPSAGTGSALVQSFTRCRAASGAGQHIPRPMSPPSPATPVTPSERFTRAESADPGLSWRPPHDATSQSSARWTSCAVALDILLPASRQRRRRALSRTGVQLSPSSRNSFQNGSDRGRGPSLASPNRLSTETTCAQNSPPQITERWPRTPRRTLL